MKLQLKHLAQYLPYDLQLQIDEIYKGFKCKLVVANYTTSFANGVEIKTALIYNSKPILRPLSDLTKEIEVNGEKFVPIEKLEKMTYNTINIYKPLNVDMPIEINIETENYSQSIDLFDGYLISQKLFEWNFDVFGLIDSGLAIDINTLK